MEQTLPPFSSSPVRAIQSVFASANWVGNVLWFTLAAMASSVFVGYIGLFGYGAELIERRAGRPEHPPVDVNPDRLGDYFSKGIWPFLVHFIVQLAASFLLLVPGFIVFFMAMAIGAGVGEDAGILVGLLIGFPILFFLAIFASVFGVPFLIRSMVCQDFATSLDFGWAWRFVKLMFWEIILSSILFGLLALGVMLVGYALCLVGAIPASGVIMGGYINLTAQWYEVYLSRGGEPAPPPPGSDMDVVDATIV